MNCSMVRRPVRTKQHKSCPTCWRATAVRSRTWSTAKLMNMFMARIESSSLKQVIASCKQWRQRCENVCAPLPTSGSGSAFGRCHVSDQKVFSVVIHLFSSYLYIVVAQVFFEHRGHLLSQSIVREFASSCTDGSTCDGDILDAAQIAATTWVTTRIPTWSCRHSSWLVPSQITSSHVSDMKIVWAFGCIGK